MNKFYIDMVDNSLKNAGSKARNDISEILDENNYKKINILGKGKWHRRFFERFLSNQFLKRLLKDVDSKSIVVIQYPLSTRMSELVINELISIKSTLVAVIHDIDSLRFSKYSLSDEINLLNKFNYVISHNRHMTEKLIENGLKSKCIELKVFDYINKNINFKNSKIKYGKDIIFAGNLSEEKCGFIYDMDLINLNLYGVGFNNDKNKSSYIKYKGSFTPDELPSSLEGAYGLVWDGPSIEGCRGQYGEYMRYNNPHKLSLYLSCNLPVIVWSESAIAEFVKDNNLGIVVKSIEDIKENIDVISKEEYSNIKLNVENIALNLRSGNVFKSIIKNIEENI